MNLSMEPIVKNKRFLILFVLLSILISCLKDDPRTPEEKEMDRQMGMIDDRKTLLGPDKNNNGVRDDVEYWINNAPEILNNDIKRATMWYAKTQRDVQMLASNKQRSIESMHELAGAYGCLSLVLREMNLPFDDDYIEDQLTIYMDNTKERHLAYLKSDRNFAGQSGRVHKFADEGCPFKLEKRYRKRGEKYVPKK